MSLPVASYSHADSLPHVDSILSNVSTAPIKRSASCWIGRLDLAQAKAVTATFEQHYNFQRPHQGLACGNRPPRKLYDVLALAP